MWLLKLTITRAIYIVFVWHLMAAHFSHAAVKEMVWIGYETQQLDSDSDILDHQIRHLFRQYLRDIRIRVESANTLRTERLLQTRPNVCVSGMSITNKRKSFSHVSKLPSSFYSAAKLYIKTDKVKQLDIVDGVVSLQDTLQNTDIVFGYNEGRSFGQELDDLFAANSNTLRPFWDDTRQDHLLNMLINGRIDAFIEYDGVVNNYYDVSTPKSALLSYEIAESKGFSPFYFMCSRTPQGLEFINEIDDLVNKLSKTSEWLTMQVMASGLRKEQVTAFITTYNQLYSTTFKSEDVEYIKQR